MNERIQKTADAIRAVCGEAEIGLILGSGLADSVHLADARTLDYHDIPNFPISTVEGHRSEWVSGKIGGKRVCMMRGRFHFYEGYETKDIILPVRVMKLLGVHTLIVTNAAGGVNTGYQPGDLMVISDHVNFSGRNPLIGPNDPDFGPRFPDMSIAYDRDLRALAHRTAAELGFSLREGVYAWMSGPSYETPAEIRMLRAIGCDAVGMSTVPEVIAARHCGIRVLGISCITNMAAGVLDQPLNHAEVIETGAKAVGHFTKLVSSVVENL